MGSVYVVHVTGLKVIDMTYRELLTQLEVRLPSDKYYSILLENAGVIVKEVRTRKKGTVATELGMTSQVFTTIYKVLHANQ